MTKRQELRKGNSEEANVANSGGVTPSEPSNPEDARPINGQPWYGKVFRVRRGGAVLAVTVFVAMSLGVLLARSSSEKDGTGDSFSLPATIVVILVATLVIYLIVTWFLGLLAGPDPEAGEIANNLGSDAPSTALLERWLARTRWYRNIGGLAGVALWFFGSLGRFPLDWLIVLGAGGILVASMLAERHQAAIGTRQRVVSLEVRDLRRYLNKRDVKRWQVLIVVWAALVPVAVLWRPMLGAYAAAGLAVLGVTRWMQGRVAARGRSLLPESLRNADDLARNLAISRSLGQPANIVALALLSPALDELEPWLDRDLIVAGGLVIFFVALFWWLQNRRLGLDWLLRT